MYLSTDVRLKSHTLANSLTFNSLFSKLGGPLYGHMFFFVYCIANFELGLCDIPFLFLVNKSSRVIHGRTDIAGIKFSACNMGLKGRVLFENFSF